MYNELNLDDIKNHLENTYAEEASDKIKESLDLEVIQKLNLTALNGANCLKSHNEELQDCLLNIMLTWYYIGRKVGEKVIK
jgi:hypothetical protein